MLSMSSDMVAPSRSVPIWLSVMTASSGTILKTRTTIRNFQRMLMVALLVPIVLRRTTGQGVITV